MCSLSAFALFGRALQVALVVKNSPANAGDMDLILRWDDPLRRKWLPTPVLWPGECHGQRSLAVYSPWGHKESDTTEHTCRLSLVIYISY